MTTFESVVEIIVEQLGVEAAAVTATATFEELGADSLDMVELVMTFEDEFAVNITDADTEKLVTVDDAVRLIDAG